MSFGRLESRKPARPMSEINMTPLIDVMLVLLVIFMVTAPLLTHRLPLELPRTEAAESRDAPESVRIAIDAQGRRFLDEQPVDEAALRQQLALAAQRNPRLEVQLRADRAVPYGEVAALIGLLQAAGLSRIGFVAEAPQPTPAK